MLICNYVHINIARRMLRSKFWQIVRARIDEHVKEAAAVLATIGLAVSAAFRLGDSASCPAMRTFRPVRIVV